ncbi:MAG TPA: TlpA disulfide reductase family protein [Vicinamibacterales bacterium]|nr:TlpA disulfide reductase family protein [Vicinamibacterales bacterium]
MRTTLASFLLLICAAPAMAQAIDGRWDAVVVANGVAVPFRFEIATNGPIATGSFFDGTRKVPSTSGRYQNGRLTLDYDFLNTVLDLGFDGRELHGTYRNRRPNARPMDVAAVRYSPQSTAAAANLPQVGGDWVMYKTAPDDNQLDVSWRLHLSQMGAEVSGAILRTSGDSGTLTGGWHDGRLTLSHFAGERPMLFEARPGAGGTLDITIDRRYTYRAARSTQLAGKNIPEPPDLAQFTGVKDPHAPLRFNGVDADGKAVSSDDARFKGKVVVLTIGGTWCPNCHDEAPFLSSLYNEFHAKGLEVAGLFFENDADFALVRPRIVAFAKRYGVTYPILFAGTTAQADAKLSQLRNFAVYPTTIIIGRDGLVRRVQAGFAGASTGAEHDRLVREERALITRLLAERR